MRASRSSRTLAASGFALVGLALLCGAHPLSAQGPCLNVSVSGAAGPSIFGDGFESGGTAAWTAPASPAYSTAATDDLAVRVDLDPALTGDHLLELRWTLATGQLYQSVTVPVTLGAEVPAGAARHVPGYPFPVRVATAGPAPAGESPALAVTSSLPVAGTSIVDAALWSDWRLTAYLDGAETPCAAPAAFRLEP